MASGPGVARRRRATPMEQRRKPHDAVEKGIGSEPKRPCDSSTSFRLRLLRTAPMIRPGVFYSRHPRPISAYSARIYRGLFPERGTSLIPLTKSSRLEQASVPVGVRNPDSQARACRGCRRARVGRLTPARSARRRAGPDSCRVPDPHHQTGEPSERPGQDSEFGGPSMTPAAGRVGRGYSNGRGERI